MAYQNVGTPRFYVSVLQWLKSLGMISYREGADWTTSGDALSLLDINPSSSITFTPGDNNNGNNDSISYQTNIPLGNIMPTDKNFFMALGHNFSTSTVADLIVRDNGGAVVCKEEVINEIGESRYNGFTIMKGDDAADIDDSYLVFSLQGTSNEAETPTYEYAEDIKIGSFLYGTYYDLPHSPDLNLTMTREYGGIKTIETKSGASLSNDFGSKPPAWGSKAAWELGDEYSPSLSRSGRKIWDLSFSYLDQRDVWGANESLGNLSTDAAGVYTPHLSTIGADPNDYDTSDVVAYEGNYAFNYSLLTAPSFYSQVIHKTNGGQLPFIFQPDVNDNTQFAICKLDSGFKFTQVANGGYNVKLKIREVW